MRLIFILIFFLILNNCSLNKDSKYWTEDVQKRKIENKFLSNVLKKSDDITTFTQEEYKIYIDAYSKKSKYPDLNQ